MADRVQQRPKSDATYWRDGTTIHEHAYWGAPQAWHWKLAGWKKHAAVVTAAAVVLAYLTHRTATLTVLAILTAAGIWWLIRNWRFRRDWVNPYNRELPPGVTVRKLARDRTRAVLTLGGFIDDKGQQQIMAVTAAKLHLPGTLAADWRQHGKRPEVTITVVPPPPGYVSFADIRELADAAAEHEIVFGLGRKNVPGVISVDSDSPHIGLSMGSGDGKSVTARNAACQLAHHGALIIVLDSKFVSQHWAAGLPNVAYARTPQEIHDLAIWMASEVDRRKQLALWHADVEGIVHANPGPRIVAILEELNVTQHELAAYWKSINGKGRSPAVTALDKVSFIGRQVLVNLVYIGQRLSAKATSGGSGDARENLGVLLMSNPAASTWKMLVGDRHALPAATSVQGRLQVVTASAVTEVQGAYVTGAQAREYATSGEIAVPRDDMPCVGGLAPVGTPERAAQHVPDLAIQGPQSPGQGNVGETPGFVPASPVPPPPPITGPEAVAQGVLTGFNSWDSAHKALMRDPAGPRPGTGKRGNAPLWDPVELADWNEQRRSLGRLVRR
jgi:hypothetical protein